MEAIRTDALTKTYGKARGILDLNLSVREEEFFGFIGPNGAGKSTTIRTLLGFLRPTSGSASLLGMDLRTGREEILALTGYLPSEVAFYPGMRVGELLELSARLRREARRPASLLPHRREKTSGRRNTSRSDPLRTDETARRLEQLCSAGALCERLRLDPGRRIDELSFGNRKKAGIVCALQHHPRLLILDEPTSGLDPLMQREFFDILDEFHQAGATIFLSSHILSEIQRHCTRAAILREGRVIACGEVGSLMKTGARRVTFRGQAPISALSGLKDLHRHDGAASFLYDGELNRLLSVLAAGDIRDLSITEPDLEEVFLHYYTDGGEDPAESGKDAPLQTISGRNEP